MFPSRQKINPDHDPVPDLLFRSAHVLRLKMSAAIQKNIHIKIVIFCELIRKDISIFHDELHDFLFRSGLGHPNYERVFDTSLFSMHDHFKFLLGTGLVQRSDRGYLPHGSLKRYLDYYEREIRMRGPSVLVPEEKDEDEAAPSFQACNQQ